MSKLETFQKFLATQSANIPLPSFMIGLLLVAFLATVFGYFYIYYGYSLSDRRSFARNLVPVAMITMFIITVIKSSLALSLGLVGALSIIRFRTAIKEPEELSYLFLAVSLGLGVGADQITITVAASIVIMVMIYLRYYFSDRVNDEYRHLYLAIASNSPQGVSMPKISEVLKEYCKVADLRRFDDTGERLEASFVVEFDTGESLEKCREALRRLGDHIEISFLDSTGS